jgi:hypothetical protein
MEQKGLFVVRQHGGRCALYMQKPLQRNKVTLRTFELSEIPSFECDPRVSVASLQWRWPATPKTDHMRTCRTSKLI